MIVGHGAGAAAVAEKAGAIWPWSTQAPSRGLLSAAPQTKAKPLAAQSWDATAAQSNRARRATVGHAATITGVPIVIADRVTVGQTVDWTADWTVDRTATVVYATKSAEGAASSAARRAIAHHEDATNSKGNSTSIGNLPTAISWARTSRMLHTL
jgi:hypothetical protein